MKKNICPVCGYSDLEEPPYDKYNCPSHIICPCCGTEFGYHDIVMEGKDLFKKWEQLNKKWKKKNSPWHFPHEKPHNWDLKKQIENLNKLRLKSRKHMCPCCGYIVLGEPIGSHDICPICFWEADTVQSTEPDLSGGPNVVSLRQAQKNFIEFGACRKEMVNHVRKPSKNDRKDLEWNLLK